MPRTRKQLPPLKAQTDNQARYIQTIHAKTLTFGLGPAGTGKTYIATRIAAEAFRDKEIEKIIITRPAVEAGEELGFMPGDMGEKIAPYFYPVREVLEEVLGKGPVEYAIKAEQIVFVPLAFMRGRTFKNAMVILDEAQNTTPTQMKLFLTRIGEGSHVIVNGDIKQTDIVGPNGLADVRSRLRNVPDVGFVTFTRDDIVRHGLVRLIAEAYENPEHDDVGELPLFITNPVANAS